MELRKIESIRISCPKCETSVVFPVDSIKADSDIKSLSYALIAATKRKNWYMPHITAPKSIITHVTKLKSYLLTTVYSVNWANFNISILRSFFLF